DAGLLPAILAAYASDPDAVAVEVVFGISERVEMLRDGRADVGLLHDRDELGGFDTENLLVEEQVAIMPPGHRLAGRSALIMADLEGEPLARSEGGRIYDPTGALVREGGQLMQLIALGRAICVVPASIHGHMRSDLVSVPVLDAPATTLLLAWPEGSRSRALAAFVRVAAAVASGDRAGAM
ncbi:MAG: LysR substrate-binding domain-containing protein, partial [Actinoallomurus sp.]